MKLLRLFILPLFLLAFTGVNAGDFPEKPNPPRLVNDFVGIFSQSEKYTLEQELVRFDKETSTQIAVAVVDDLHGYDPADYTIRLAEKWGIGRKGKDNGILIMIKPTGGAGQRHAFIAVGYGLEGVIPDAIANRIVDKEMIPEFKLGNYYKGVKKAVETLMALSRGEFTAEDYKERTASPQGDFPFGAVLIMLLFFFFFFIKPFASAARYSRANNIGLWAAFWLLLSSGRSGGGHWDNFTGGSGGFGGGFGGGGFGSGGGFGGFGGGSFGGGGAGGSW